MARIVGFTCSTFDLLHPGHVAMLAEAKSACHELWVGLQTGVPDRPGKEPPIQTVYERYTQLEGCAHVDKIVPYESEADLMNLLLTLPLPHVRFVGQDYVDKSFTGRHLYCDAYYSVNDLKTAGFGLSDEWIGATPGIPESININGRVLCFNGRAHNWSATDFRKRIAKHGDSKAGLHGE